MHFHTFSFKQREGNPNKKSRKVASLQNVYWPCVPLSDRLSLIAGEV